MFFNVAYHIIQLFYHISTSPSSGYKYTSFAYYLLDFIL